ncbi:MAG: radical SAM protein, partial [bacterium]|nr:radical SAM protein [bacterium]
PLPDYSICFDQYEFFLGEKGIHSINTWYETSRGCWWAEKMKCSFCGIALITYRQKSVTKVVHDLKTIRESFGDILVFMADNIIPHTYHRDLLPLLSETPSLAYQLRVTLDLKDLIELKNGKVDAVLPGIETFSTNLLKSMNKGTAARQGLLFLRNARSVGIRCDWFMLWGFPGDRVSDYEDLLSLLPLIRHLQAPRIFEHIILLRFSPYVENRERYGIKNLRPWNGYTMIYPSGADIEKLAVNNAGEYSCEAHENPELIREIAGEIETWKQKWSETFLVMKELMGSYIVLDNRDIHEKNKKHILDFDQAKEIMTACVYNESAGLQWAVKERLGVVLDSWYVPLVTASAELLLQFEEE